MEATQLIDYLVKGGAGLFTVFLVYAVYVLWSKLQSEQDYSRKRDEQIALLLQEISKSLSGICVKIDGLQNTIFSHLLEWKDQE